MKSVSIQEAQADLAQLVEDAAGGNPFVIAKAGRPMVKVVPLEANVADVSRRIGGLEHLSALLIEYESVPDKEIRSLFEDRPLFPSEEGSSK